MASIAPQPEHRLPRIPRFALEALPPVAGLAFVAIAIVVFELVRIAGVFVPNKALVLIILVGGHSLLCGWRWGALSCIATFCYLMLDPNGMDPIRVAMQLLIFPLTVVLGDNFRRRLRAQGAAIAQLHRSLNDSRTHNRSLTEHMREPQRTLRMVLDQFPGLASYCDAQMRYVLVSASYAEYYGRPITEIEGRRVDQVVFDPAALRHVIPRLTAVLRGEPQVFMRPAESNAAMSGWKLQTSLVPVRDGDGNVEGYFAFSMDVSERLDNEERLRRERERALVTLQSIADAVVTVDAEGLVDYMNPVAQALTGWDDVGSRGRSVREVLALGTEQSMEAVENPVERCLTLGSPVTMTGDTILCDRDGRVYAVDMSVSPIPGGDTIQGAVVVFRDVGAARRLSQQLTWQAEHDALTGLANRRRFERALELAIESASHREEEHAVMYLDLDQFKIVNDTCGHAAGDRLLRELTQLLSKAVRESDLLARLGGDEFGVLLRDCPLDKAIERAESMRAAIEDHFFCVEGRTFVLGASFGVVPIDKTSASLAEVLRAADAACYLAKEGGRNRVHRGDADDRALRNRQDEMEWLTRVQRAIEDDRLELHGQPIVPLKPGEVGHVEVLVRMRTEDGHLVPPMKWIPAAERYGLMPRVDRWVIRHAFAYIAQRPAGEPPRHCAINLSGMTITDPGFLGYVRDTLVEFAIEPSHVCFEITETAVIANLQLAQRFIDELRTLGVQFSLDDFGCGMSSFGHLKALRVDYLKIDGSFVRRILEDPVDLAMVEAINNLGHVMGIRTVAEFVETPQVLNKLMRLGIDFAQGHGIAEPRPLAELAGLAIAAPATARVLQLPRPAADQPPTGTFAAAS